MQRLLMVIVLITLCSVHILALERAGAGRKSLPDEGNSYVIPSPVLRITALEFSGLTSDFLFLKAMVFWGGAVKRQETPRVKDWEWRWFYNALNAATDLDPYFLDPYYLGNAHLPWEGGMIKETNTLLEKGSRYRDWDWALPFFIGFNYFYFLHDNDKASEYLMTASKRPGASPIFVSLATKLAYRARRTENAITFMEKILEITGDEKLRKQYEIRLDGLRKLFYLEKAVAFYKKKFNKTPAGLDELLLKNIIKEIPKDPYGGEFYIDPLGIVNSTSNFMTVYDSR